MVLKNSPLKVFYEPQFRKKTLFFSEKYGKHVNLFIFFYAFIGELQILYIFSISYFRINKCLFENFFTGLRLGKVLKLLNPETKSLKGDLVRSP